MNEIFDEEEYLREYHREYNNKRNQRLLAEKFDKDPEYRSKIKNQAEKYLAKLKLSPEYNSAVKEYHQSDEFRSNPVPFSKTALYRKIVTDYIYSLSLPKEEESDSMKQCRDCGEEKTLDQFYFMRQIAAYTNNCKKCRNLHSLNYQRKLRGIQEDS